MNTTTSVVATGVVVAAGQWSQNKQISIRVIIGMGVLAIGLAAMGEVNAQLAEQFGLLVLISAVLLYTLPIAKGLGYTK